VKKEIERANLAAFTLLERGNAACYFLAARDDSSKDLFAGRTARDGRRQGARVD
jgi:hypothetical protein